MRSKPSSKALKGRNDLNPMQAQRSFGQHPGRQLNN